MERNERGLRCLLREVLLRVSVLFLQRIYLGAAPSSGSEVHLDETLTPRENFEIFGRHGRDPRTFACL